MEDFKYYTMNRKGDEAYPLIRVADLDYNPDKTIKQLHLEFNGTVPKNPVMVDYLSGPYDFVTKRIAEVMKAMNMRHVQFIPIELTDNKGNTIDDYVAISVKANNIKALDMEEFDYEINEDDEDDLWISKIVLDKEVLSKIPLNERLGFCLREAPGYRLYHKSVIDVIQSFDPTGVYYVNIEDYVI